MHNRGAPPGILVQPPPEHLPEGQQGVWGVGDAVVWPGHIVELSHGQGLPLLCVDGGWVGGGRAQNGARGGWILTGRGIPGARCGPVGEWQQIRPPGVFWGGDCPQYPSELAGWGGGATHMAQLQLPDCPVLRLLLPLQGHLQVPVGAGLGVERPIMLALHLGEDAGLEGRRP